MLQLLVDFLKSATFRRVIAALLGVAVVTLNAKFGLDLNADAIAGVVVVVAIYLAQSAFKSIATVKAEASVEAAKVVNSLPAAVEELKK